METEIPQIPEIPSLEQGVTLLESTEHGPLHSLVIDHILMQRTSAVWVDTGGYAQVEPLAEIVPSKRVLDRIQVGRAFTAYQHYTLCERLVTMGVDRHGDQGLGDEDVGLIVVPAIDALYRDEDLRDSEGEEMLVHALARLARAARQHECPVLVSRVRDDELSKPIERLAEATIACETTSYGPRFVGEEFETLVYPLGDGWLQTTLAFWKHILEARQPVYPTVIRSGSIREVA